ncbi:MAG: helix-turn-helix domain-containing protein [Labrenzia sp.]
MDNKTVSVRLREALNARKHKKLFAFSHEIGVSPSTVTRWLQGQPIRSENLIKIARVLNISLDWLLLGEGNMEAGPISGDKKTAKLRNFPPEMKQALADFFFDLID